MFEASSVLWQGIKCAILENRSTTTKTESRPLFVLGHPNTKFIERSIRGALGMGIGV